MIVIAIPRCGITVSAVRRIPSQRSSRGAVALGRATPFMERNDLPVGPLDLHPVATQEVSHRDLEVSSAFKEGRDGWCERSGA